MRETLIKGYCYPPGSSNRKRAELYTRGDLYELLVDRQVVKSGNLHDLRFSDRIGSINRKVFFDSGTQFETPENDRIDELLSSANHKNTVSTTVSRLESSWTIAIGSILGTALLVLSFFKFGLPAAADYAAHKIPVSASENLSDGALDLLDEFLFKDTTTTASKQEEITNRFNGYISSIEDTGGFNYSLHFRDIPGTANALALPGGDIVLTDELIKLTTDEELDSIILHEIGHVVQRHGLEGVIKGATMAVLVNIALGDLSTVAELTASTTTFFMQSSYTRSAESEADEYSFTQMERLNIDPIHFATAMQKITLQSGSEQRDSEATEYLSSHPSTDSRIKKAKERSEAFNQR